MPHAYPCQWKIELPPRKRLPDLDTLIVNLGAYTTGLVQRDPANPQVLVASLANRTREAFRNVPTEDRIPRAFRVSFEGRVMVVDATGMDTFTRHVAAGWVESVADHWNVGETVTGRAEVPFRG